MEQALDAAEHEEALGSRDVNPMLLCCYREGKKGAYSVDNHSGENGRRNLGTILRIVVAAYQLGVVVLEEETQHREDDNREEGDDEARFMASDERRDLIQKVRKGAYQDHACTALTIGFILLMFKLP